MLRSRSRNSERIIGIMPRSESNSASRTRHAHHPACQWLPYMFYRHHDVFRCFRFVLLSAIMLLVLCATLRFVFLLPEGSSIQIQNPFKMNVAMRSYTGQADQPMEHTSRSAFLVDRSILEKLERMQQVQLEDAEEQNNPLDPHYAKPTFRWPPSVTRMPEPQSTGVDSISPNISCGALDSNPCRFILPLRIAEQESKARIHFIQFLQLARNLNRTLVLPNVGKSRLGACLKWDFEMYYDLERLNTELDGTPIVKMDVFKQWVEMQQNVTTAQIVSISSKKAAPTNFYDIRSLSDRDIVVQIDNNPDVRDFKLPSCFRSKFRRLDLDWFSTLSIRPSDLGEETFKDKAMGSALLDALSRQDIRTAAFRPNGPSNDILHPDSEIDSQIQPDVLLVDWNLRHPVFPESSFSRSRTLHYSPELISFAEKLGPSHPYLVVHWRMESIPPETLPECAHSLIDMLSNLLREESFADGIQTVWLATDYPYPFSRVQSEAIMKSGTFKDVGEQHAKAVRILTAAFGAGGELEGWKLTGLAEALDAVGKDVLAEEEIVNDSGVLGILDKIIAMQATLFVSGAKRCSRKSSFTKQVVDARRDRQARNRGPHISQRNIVKIFG